MVFNHKNHKPNILVMSATPIPRTLTLAAYGDMKESKLIEKPLKNSLIVDDVFETGITLSNYKNIEGINFFVLVSKKKPIWWKTVNLSLEEEWIVFPWENKENELKDEKEYKSKRRLK